LTTPYSVPTTPPAAEPPATSYNDTANSNTVGMPKSSTLPPAPPPLSENQIAMITDLANSSEIEQAKLAQTKAKSASVKKFAAMMLKHHGEAKAEQAKLYKQLNLTPTQSQSASSLKDGADRALGSLRGANGNSFDLEYIDTQVDAHQKVLEALDSELLPAATDQQLITSLNKMRATVEAHLKEAKIIQAELAARPPTAQP
jgi:putative membrane protein